MDRVVEKRSSVVPKQPKLVRVAAYARVSSGKDEMLHSLSAQISYYSGMIQEHSGWLYCGVYSDEAKTGTKATRPGFQQMLTDCRARKLDLVITKSISRFARNTVTLLQTVRELKELGIDVYFEEQNLHTIGPDGELIMTILAAYAQEESLSVSENQKWRVRKNFEDGKPWDGTLIGYRYKDGMYIVQPEEAEIVRGIYREYLSGKGVDRIANELNAAGAKTRLGCAWRNNGVLRVLRNYSYTGNLLLQKYFRDDVITKRSRLNDGDLPQYHVQNSHEAIISLEDFWAVQDELERRSKHHAPKGKNYNAQYTFSSLITCGNCGKKYHRKVTKTGAVWICSTYNHKGKSACASKQIPETTLLGITEDIDMSRITGITAENLPYKHFLGYERGAKKDDPPVVNPEQAVTVRRIYRMFMEGKTVGMISRELTAEGVPTPSGKTVWRASTINSILQNEKYRGSALLQKRFTTDFLTKSQKINEGEVPSYYVEKSHEPIIDPVEWDAVQDELARRKAIGRSYSGKSVLGAKIKCGDCGCWYGEKVWHSTDSYKSRVWQCNGKYSKDTPRCETPALREEDLKMRFLMAFNSLIADKKPYITACEAARLTLTDTTAIEAEMQELLQEMEVVSGLTKKCIEENSTTAQDQDEYTARYNGYVDRYEKAKARYNELASLCKEKQAKASAISRFLATLRERKELLSEFDDRLWLTMVNYATVHSDGTITFCFHDGTEITN